MEAYQPPLSAPMSSANVGVTGVYDRPESARRLKNTLDGVSAKIGEAVLFDLHLWRSDILHLAECNAAMREGLWQSELLIVAFTGNEDGILTPGLFGVVEKWSNQRCGRHAVLVASPDSCEGSAATVAHLRALAQRLGLHFLCTCDHGDQ